MDVVQHHYPCFSSPPMKWFKMKVLGRGSYGTVHLAMATTNTTGCCCSSSGFMAVKSAVIEKSFSLMKEAVIHQEFVNCPEVVRGLGFEFSYEGCLWIYNLLRKLDEIDVQKYTRMILRGLRCTQYEKGYVHCDLNLENILVFSSPDCASKSVKMIDDLVQLGCNKWGKNSLKCLICQLVLGSVVYNLWRTRNELRHDGVSKTEEQLLKQIFWEIRARIAVKRGFPITRENLLLCSLWNLPFAILCNVGL